MDRDRWRTAMGLSIALGLATACDDESKHLDQATAEHAAGDLEGALTTLELAVGQNPKSEAARAANAKATQWLVAAADSATSPYEKKARLEQALKWSPDNGPAHVRLCELMLEGKKLTATRECVGKELEGKSDVPKDRVDAVRRALAVLDDARTAGERKRWLASPSSHHWAALVKKYPESPEAAKALEKIRLSASLCSDLSRFVEALEQEIEKQNELAEGISRSGKHDVKLNARMSAYDDIGKSSRARAKAMKDTASAVEVHALADGEQAAQKNLRAAFWVLADSATALGEALERHPLENLEAYDAIALGALRKWAGTVAASMAKAKSLIADAHAKCESDAGAREAAPKP